MSFFHKGVIWFSIATVVEVPPVVSLTSFFPARLLFDHLHFTSQVFIILDCDGISSPLYIKPPLNSSTEY